MRPKLPNGDYEFDELAGKRITKIVLMGLIEIRFGEQHENLQIQIESPFRITGDAAEPVVIRYQPGNPQVATGLNTLAGLHNATVHTAVARVHELQLDLSTQHGHHATLTVPPDPQYEAWHFTGPRGVFVSTPGGRSVQTRP